MSPALNGSSEIRRFEHAYAIEIRDGIMFVFYSGLPQVQSLAEKEKKMSDIRTKFQHLSNSTIWEVALEKFPFHSSDATLEHIIGLDFSKSTPPAFSQFCSETVKQQALPKFSHLRTRNAPATHFRQYLKPLIRQS